MTVLVVRPGPQGVELVTQLRQRGIIATHCPLLRYEPIAPSPKTQMLLQDLSRYAIVIALSPRAVEFIEPWRAVGPFRWSTQVEYYGIGAASAQALQQRCGQLVGYPSGRSSSESLLSLPRFLRVTGERILLLRGQGGRHHLVSSLTQRGASVSICECYRRVQIVYNGLEQSDLWQQAAVNCLVVTSGEILQRLYTLVPKTAHRWLLQCSLLVVSPRLARLASRLGWSTVVIADNADNASLLHALVH
jgi:uroporphyrinogen-III synthase